MRSYGIPPLFESWKDFSDFFECASRAGAFNSLDDIIEMQIELMKMRTDDDLLIEPHPFIKTDFNTSNPVVSEILKNGIELTNYEA